MKLRITFVFFFITIIALPLLKAQDVKKDLKLIEKAYKNNKHLSFDIDYLLYENHSTKKIMQRKNGFYIKDNQKQLTYIDGFTNLYTEKSTLIVDTNNSIIILSDAISFDKELLTMVNIDSLSKTYSSVEYKKESNGNTSYYFKIKENIYSQIDALIITFDTNTYLMTSIVLYFRYEMKLDASNKNSKKDKVRMEIIFRKINTSPKHSNIKLDTKQYIKKYRNEYKGIGKYSNYKIIDQRLLQKKM